MADNTNWSIPSMGGTTEPANAGALMSGSTWGIDNEIANCIIQSESITSEDIVDDTQDQKGAMVSRLTYDKHWTLNLTLLTSTPSALTQIQGTYDFTYGGHKWFVNSVTYNGSYNQKKSYTINAERYQNYPAQS